MTLSAAKPEVTINFTLRTESHLVPYVLRVKAAPGTGYTVLAPYVNGRSLGSKRIAAGGSQMWFVPTDMLATGAATLRLRLAPYRRAQFNEDHRIERSFAEHEAILEQVLRGAGEEAAQLMRVHILTASAALAQYMRRART